MNNEEVHGESQAAGSAGPVEERRPNWFMRARVPLWVALPLLVVGVLFAFFIGYPQRSVSSAVERMFRDTDNVEISYCLSNEAAKDADRWKAEERFKDELKSLGVHNVSVRFVSPCPPASSPEKTAPPQTSTAAARPAET